MANLLLHTDITIRRYPIHTNRVFMIYVLSKNTNKGVEKQENFNYLCIYIHFRADKKSFKPKVFIDILLLSGRQNRPLHIVDGVWIGARVVEFGKFVNCRYLYNQYRDVGAREIEDVVSICSNVYYWIASIFKHRYYDGCIINISKYSLQGIDQI